MTALLDRWTKRLAGGPQAGTSDSLHYQGSWEWVDNNNRNVTLQAIHTDAVNNAVKDKKKNIVLDGIPHPINDTEKDLTRSAPPSHC